MSDKTYPMPTLGRIVHLKLSPQHVAAINHQRSLLSLMANPVSVGQIVPMIITAVHSETCVNGKLILDGPDTLWVLSATRADDADMADGDWKWPERV